MASFECSGCGNFVQDSEKYCPYCGNPNPNYVEPTRAALVNQTPTVPTNVTNNAPVPTQTNNNSSNNAGSSSNNNTSTNARPSTTNWLVFILLLFIFWPAAVIYLIVTNR